MAKKPVATISLHSTNLLGYLVASLAVAACSSSSTTATANPDGGSQSVKDSGSPIVQDSGSTMAEDSSAEASAPWDPSGSPPPPNVPPTGAQTPPTNGAAVRTWLAAGSYKSWHCEQAPHASRSPSPHQMNRICSNDLASSYVPADGGSGERPEGTAAVKELYDTTGTTIRGYAVYLKAAATSEGGANWYWYESDPTVPASTRDSMNVLADGFGGSGGGPKGICVGCHTAAGSDVAHTPTPGSSDFVYTQVH